MPSRPAPPLHVVLIVLGDFGRSPRMQYHAQSLLDQGHSVTCIGYVGEDLMLTETSDRLRVIRLNVPVPKILKSKRYLLPVYFLWRILSLSFCLVYTLATQLSHKKHVDCMLIQNPPAIPLLLIALLYCKIIQAGLVVDWHNVGYSMIANDTRKTNQLARYIAQTYEQVLAPYATGHLVVTRAMQHFLEQHMKVPSTVLYDCPPTMFQPISLEQQHELLTRLTPQFTQACPTSWTHRGGLTEHQTLFTEYHPDTNTIQLRSNRPKLVVSSTSWTPDEDFDMLLQALVALDTQLVASSTPTNIIVMVTGKGPLKQYYQEKMSKLSLQHICCSTLWLSPQDYPLFIACADLGISLHTSTSGLDLPMKIQDCFGCAVPVCARHFACLDELIVDGRNGRVFENANELCEQLKELLVKEGGEKELDKYRQAVLRDRVRWHENWMRHGWPVIEQAATKR